MVLIAAPACLVPVRSDLAYQGYSIEAARGLGGGAEVSIAKTWGSDISGVP